MQYNVGDKVLVRSDLVVGRSYFDYQHMSVLFVSDMKKFIGQTVEIREVERPTSGWYYIKGCNYIWTNSMFEGLASESFCDISESMLTEVLDG